MPRLYTSVNDALDFCNECFPDMAEAEEEYGDVGEGPDDRGNCFEHRADHPDYADHNYDCKFCGKRLTSGDN